MQKIRWNVSRCFSVTMVTIMISKFVFIFSQPNRKKICWPEEVLCKISLVPCCCAALLNHRMFFRHRNTSAFFGICCSKFKSKLQTPVKKYQFFRRWFLPKIRSLISCTISTAQYFWNSESTLFYKQHFYKQQQPETGKN